MEHAHHVASEILLLIIIADDVDVIHVQNFHLVNIVVALLNMLNSHCTLCHGKPLLTFQHISSASHRALIAKLPYNFWKMSDATVFKAVHKNIK